MLRLYATVHSNNQEGRTVLVGDRRGGIARVALLEDAFRGSSMGGLHLITVVTPLCTQLLGQSLVAHQISLCGLQAHSPSQTLSWKVWETATHADE